MSRYRPAISIRTDAVDPSVVTGAVGGDTTYDAIASKVEKYSITPRTLKAVTEFDPAYVVASQGAASSVASALAYNPELYTSIEEYSYASNNVVRYSIRSDLITPDPSGAILGEGNSGPRGPSMKTAMYNKSMSQAAILHSLEKDIITRVITSFISAPGIITAIVDIFERNDGININRDLITGHPIVHSVVLHFIPSDGVVCVIDPSNFLFSNHLENNDFSTILASRGLPQVKTLTVNRQIKLYAPAIKPEGPAFDQYRDCTDIAVKIAFGLNKHPILKFSDYDNEEAIKSHPVFVMISNQPSIDGDIIEDYPLPSRIKQASSLLCQETFSKLQYTLNTNKQMFNKFKDDSSKAWFIPAYLTIMTTEAEHNDILGTLKNLDDACNTRIDGELRKCIGDVLTE